MNEVVTSVVDDTHHFECLKCGLDFSKNDSFFGDSDRTEHTCICGDVFLVIKGVS